MLGQGFYMSKDEYNLMSSMKRAIKRRGSTLEKSNKKENE